MGAMMVAASTWNPPPFLEDAPQQTTSDASARSAAVAAVRPVSSPGVARGVSDGAEQDTLRRRILAGDILIVALPGEVDGESVDRYSLVRGPALSWLIDRSLMWRTTPGDTGGHDVLIRVDLESSPADTLVVSVHVE